MMRPNINYYALLGVPSTATQEEITRAYRKKILEVHLDKIGEGEDTDLCYKTIEAYRVISNRKLRAKYDIQRDSTFKAEEVFVPAGYICYDVGENQMSKRVLQDIAQWKKDFEEMQMNNNGYSDNYFECFSNLMAGVMDSNESGAEVIDKKTYFCGLCDKKFLTETHHWEEMLYPYVKLFPSDKSGVGALYNYFENLLGAKSFNWKPRRLPSRLLGIWGSEEWLKFTHCDKIISDILSEIPSDDDIGIEEQIEYIQETFLISESEMNEAVYPQSACKTFCWMLEHQNDQEAVVNKLSDHLMSDEVTEIMYIASVMKNLLECGGDEWRELTTSALEAEQPELAMLWTKIGIEFGDTDETQWYKLGMKLRDVDPVLAHFCFLSGGFECDEDWENIGNEFIRKKNHFAALEYHLKLGNIDFILEKSRKLAKSDAETASIYRNVYHSLKIKTLLANLQKRKSDDDSHRFDSDLEKLIQFIKDLAGKNPLEGFGIIASTWSKTFEDPICHEMHRTALDILKRKEVTVKSYNLILGGMHIIPPDDVDLEELAIECEDLVINQIEKSMKRSDFDSLTEILLYLSRRSVSAAVKVLSDMEEESQQILISTSPHLKAMKFLIQGTVSKIQRNWMGAMGEYQNALLCSPECMHRVLPCISKLSQDIEFHEAVVSEVESECKELKDYFDSEEYPEVENYASNRNSLVLSDVAPKIDFGYKNLMSKLKPDPDKFVNQPPPPETDTERPVETNTPMVTLDKNEEAIQSGQNLGGPMAQLNAALSYIDLLKALPVPFQPGPIVMAASHFLRAMDETDDTGSLFAYRNVILQMAETLIRIDGKTQATIQHCLTHKHMLSILLSAHEKLSKALGGENSDDLEDSDDDLEDSDDDSEEECRKSTKGRGIDLISTSEANLISKFLKNVVSFPKIEPLANIPTLNCSDLVYVETLGNSFLSQFCSGKVGEKYQSPKIPKHLHAYTHFVEVWKGRSSLTDFDTARIKAMEELLALRGWTHEDVEELMRFPLLNLTSEGFTLDFRTELVFSNPSKSYRNIHGFKIDYERGKIEFLLTKDSHTAFSPGNLFDTEDIREIFSNDIDIKKGSLSLISPDVTFKSHPFKEIKFDPRDSQSWARNYLQTLARAAMLLCYFASGWEICAKTPFYMKRTDEGLLNRLDEHLQHLLRPVGVRKQENGKRNKPFNPESDIPNRFWLNISEVFEEEEEDATTFTYKVGEVNAQIKVNTLVMTLNGTKTNLSAEAAFARDFTRHYDEIGLSFPELLRLKEFVKISLICTKLKGILREKIALVKQNGRSKEDIAKINNICEAIRELGISGDTQDELHTFKKNRNKDSSDCLWLPATFCNNYDIDLYEVSAGVNMVPEVTYGPVCPPSDSRYVSATQLL